MRIMMVTIGHGGPTESGGGAELHVQSLAQALSERGHRVALLTKRLPGRPAQLPGVEAIFSTTTIFPHIITKLFQFDPVVYLTTLRFLRTWSPDIVHLHSFLDISFAPIAAAARLQIPVLVTVHSHWPVCLRNQLCYNEDRTCQRRYVREVCAPCLVRGLRNQTGVRFPVSLVSVVLRGAWRARQQVLQRVARFVAPSGALAWSLRESGFPADRIVILPHDLPQGDFAVRPRKPKPGQTGVHLLCVGRLVPGKGVQYLLEALNLVRQVRPDAILTVTGDGTFRPELEDLCASLGLTAAVRFIGAQSRSRLPELYAEADLLVLPTLSEVFSYVALEAAATGVPVVATNVGAIPEILGDGAFLVPPMDPEALAEGILTALSDRTAAAARAKLAQERYLARFDFGTMVDRTEAVYAELRHRAHVP
jgi:glycosyltransferase involved in cell wall biosynthesis